MTLGQILLEKDVCDRAGIERTTLWRLEKRGEGPPRVRLTTTRKGYPENLFNEWLASRLERPLVEKKTA